MNKQVVEPNHDPQFLNEKSTPKNPLNYKKYTRNELLTILSFCKIKVHVSMKKNDLQELFLNEVVPNQEELSKKFKQQYSNKSNDNNTNKNNSDTNSNEEDTSNASIISSTSLSTKSRESIKNRKTSIKEESNSKKNIHKTTDGITLIQNLKNIEPSKIYYTYKFTYFIIFYTHLICIFYSIISKFLLKNEILSNKTFICITVSFIITFSVNYILNNRSNKIILHKIIEKKLKMFPNSFVYLNEFKQYTCKKENKFINFFNCKKLYWHYFVNIGVYNYNKNYINKLNQINNAENKKEIEGFVIFKADDNQKIFCLFYE